MTASMNWQAGSATDTGLERAVNEDRVLIEEQLGLFLVVDGLGGHAAGEFAAETAMQVIRGELSNTTESDASERVRRAITAANNRIYELAQSSPDWSGMACVLTLALLDGEILTIGHVGDSRLYMMWNGALRKLTSDHSPVGEQEDRGELSEGQAMRHPRRNEVFRDVGSRLHEGKDLDFIEIKTVAFHPDAALLLASDGLTDCVNSAEMLDIVERYDGDAGKTAGLLVEAANTAGGRDNVSVIFVAGGAFTGSRGPRARHATTRMRTGGAALPGFSRSVFLFLAGIVLGILLWRIAAPTTSVEPPLPIPRAPRDTLVNPADSLAIVKALSTALPGDIINVPPGDYLGPLQLKDRVTLVSTASGRAILRSDPASSAEPGIAIVARGVPAGRLEGFRIISDETHPLHTGILIVNSSIEADDIEISGAIDAAIHVEGESHPLLLGNFIHSNSGAGVVIRHPAMPRLVANQISENGLGIDTDSKAQPVLFRNVVERNGKQSR
jgi:PPM family protein phosphatase